MKSNEAFERFGELRAFAIDVRLLPDPDGDDGAPQDSVGSWGQWRLWVNGLNLCEHDLFPDDGDPQPRDSVTWYLAPLVRWVAEMWGPLLHEERLPSPSRETTARESYLSALGARSRNSEAFVPWQEWSSRHSVRWVAEGGLVPDIFLRRLGDDIEVSWGGRLQPGGDAAQFRLETGVGHAPVSVVAEALDGLLRWAEAEASWRARPWFSQLAHLVEARSGAGAEENWLRWFIEGADPRHRLGSLYHALKAKFERVSPSLFDERTTPLCLAGISPAIAMFGAVSPNISEAAAARLLEITANSTKANSVSAPVDQFVEPQSTWGVHSPWNQGYELAGYFLEDAEAVPTGDYVNLLPLIEKLGIDVLEEGLGEEGPRGVALAGSTIVPTVVVNIEHEANRSDTGKRFTFAHELCHILYDRDRARRITHPSTPWAPPAIEQRANAFAAMLLMPPQLIRRVVSAMGGKIDAKIIADAARTMRVSRTALIHHLFNLGEISLVTRDRLLEDFFAA